MPPQPPDLADVNQYFQDLESFRVQADAKHLISDLPTLSAFARARISDAQVDQSDAAQRALRLVAARVFQCVTVAVPDKHITFLEFCAIATTPAEEKLSTALRLYAQTINPGRQIILQTMQPLNGVDPFARKPLRVYFDQQAVDTFSTTLQGLVYGFPWIDGPPKPLPPLDAHVSDLIDHFLGRVRHL